MALDQAAFNATVIAVENNKIDGLLDLSNQGITDSDLQLLSIALTKSTLLTYLDLSGNFISATGASALADALKINTSISVLVLASNKINDAGATSLAEALKINTSLYVLELPYCQVGDMGANALGEALKINTSLNYLGLSNNQISDTGAQTLISSISHNYSLTILSLTGNSINSNNLSQINAVIARNEQYLQLGPVYNTDGEITRSGANNIKISQGGTVILTLANLDISALKNVAIFLYITEITHGRFFYVMNNQTITSFTQGDIVGGVVGIIQDGGYDSLEYSVTASNGTVTTPPHKAAVIFTRQPNPPVLLKNNFTLIQNSNTSITTNNFLAGFANFTTSALPGLIFNVFNLTGGQFQEVNQTTPLLSFTQGEVINDQIEFACAPGQYPSCEIQVGDGNRTDLYVPAVFNLLPCTALQQAIIDLNNNAITSLNLSNQNIGDWGVGLLAAALQNNTSLTSINLENNKIGRIGGIAIANALKINRSITQLIFDSNPIDDEGVISIAQALEINTSVTTLHIGDEISMGVSDIGATALATMLKINTSLTNLYLGGNQIGNMGASALADALTVNRSLTYLYLHSNPIGDIGISALADALKINNSLGTLYLSYNQLIGAAGAAALASAFQVNTSLRVLGLADTAIGDIGATAIANALQINTSLNSIDLTDNQIGNNGTIALAGALESNQSLISLYLGDNNIADAGATVLITALQNNYSLTTLDYIQDPLASNPISQANVTQISALLARNTAVIQAITRLKNNDNTLTILDLSNMQINDAGAILIGAVLKNNTSLLNLNFYGDPFGYVVYGHSIRSIGAQALAEALKINNTLTKLNLAYNPIGDTGAGAFALMLQSNNNLDYLGLEESGITAAGAQLLAAALPTNMTLKTIVLANNSIGDLGVIAIANALNSNTSITSLQLAGCSISDIGVNAIAMMLQNNSVLTQLTLHYNPITDAGVIAIASALKANTILTYLDLSGSEITNTSIGDSGAIALAETLKVNTSIKALELRSNLITDVGAEALLGALQNNYSITTLDLAGNTGVNQTIIDTINLLLIRNQQYPSFTVNHITATEGKTITLSAANIAATTPTGSITYTVSAVEHGRFLDASNQPITTFTQTEINDGAIRFESFDFNRVPPSYNITATNGNFTTPPHIGSVDLIPVNHAPLLLNPIPNQAPTVGDPFELQIPNNTFIDPDNDPLRLSLTDASGEAPPAWLHFNATSRILSGTPNQTQTDQLRLTTSDSSNLTASIDFQLQAVPKSATTTTNSSSSQAGTWIGVGVGVSVGVLATAVGIGLWRRIRAQKSAVQPAPDIEASTIPMTDNTELRRLSSLPNYDTVLPDNQGAYEQPKPLYEVNWRDESSTDPSYDAQWSKRDYDIAQKESIAYDTLVDEGDQATHLGLSALPLYEIAQSDPISTTEKQRNNTLLFQPSKNTDGIKPYYELLDPGAQFNPKPNTDTYGFGV